MFDPKVWISEQFQDAELVPQGQRRIITMTVPLGLVVAITSIYYRNGDVAAAHDVRVRFRPGTTTEAAVFSLDNVMSDFAVILFPIMPLPVDNVKILGPWFIQGPCELLVTDDSNMTPAGGGVQEFNLSWLQGRFDGKTSTPVVPVGSTV